MTPKAKHQFNRYDRQQRIKHWNQESLKNARLLVAGAGALGNEYLKNIALSGIGHILVIDFDHIEGSNLNRTVLFREFDIGKNKAEIAASAIQDLNPDIDIRFMNANLLYDIGLGFIRNVDLVAGCLDNLAARAHLGISCSLTSTPYLDGGMWSMGGEVRWFLPGDNICFDCTLSSDDRQMAYQRRSCSGYRDHEMDDIIPAHVSTTSVISGIMAQETVRYLCGWDVDGGEAIVYNGLSMKLHKSKLSGNPDCTYHVPYPDIISINDRVSGMSAIDLLKLTEKDFTEKPLLELGRDFLLGFECKSCGTEQRINQNLYTIYESQIMCPDCSKPREAIIISNVDASNYYSEYKLDQLGVPPGEILTIRSGDKLKWYELHKDIETFWA